METISKILERAKKRAEDLNLPYAGALTPQGPYAQVAMQPQMTQQQAVSMFQAGPAQRTQSPPASPFHIASIRPEPRNVDRARALLREAGEA